METKRCTKCNNDLPLIDFDFRYDKRRRPDERQPACRVCRNALRRNKLNTDEVYKQKVSDARKAQRRELREKVIARYGGKCNCSCGCSVDTFEYLTFDHINGREGEHRRKEFNRTGFAGALLIKWIVKNNYPDIIQVLCYNCNCSKGAHGVCPRVKELHDVDRNDLRQQILWDLEAA